MNELSNKNTKINNGQDQSIRKGWKSRFILYGIITAVVFDIFFYNLNYIKSIFYNTIKFSL